MEAYGGNPENINEMAQQVMLHIRQKMIEGIISDKYTLNQFTTLSDEELEALYPKLFLTNKIKFSYKLKKLLK